jgi:uncharacterized oxidoreductase
MKLQGNTVLVTGGTSGIGSELARRLLERGNVVVITGRSDEGLEAAKKKLPGVHALRCDVRDPKAIDALFERIQREFPRLNVLVNNAGVMKRINLHTADIDAGGDEIETNLGGTIRMILRFLPLLKTQEEAAIVNVSSGLAFNPYPIAPVYAATKAAVHSFTQSLRVQLKYTRVRVFELAPPAVDTPLNHVFAADLEGTPLLDTATLVDAALKGIEKDRLEIRIGFANLSKLMSRLAPILILRVLSKPVERMLAEPKQLAS